MAHPSYPIRPALPHDAPAIADVHQASREAIYRGRVPEELFNALSSEERLDRWVRWLADPMVITLVGEVDGRIAGFGTLRAALERDRIGPDVAEMPTLYLHPSHWRRGLGSALCRAIEARAVDEGFRTLVLWVMEMNDGARAFYVARGFAEDGAEMNDIAPDQPWLRALRYRKSLT